MGYNMLTAEGLSRTVTEMRHALDLRNPQGPEPLVWGAGGLAGMALAASTVLTFEESGNLLEMFGTFVGIETLCVTAAAALLARWRLRKAEQPRDEFVPSDEFVPRGDPVPEGPEAGDRVSETAAHELEEWFKKK